MTVKTITISNFERSVVLVGAIGSQAGTGIFASSLQGWYSTPELKVNQTERQTGNGAFDVSQQDILYAARTVTIGITIRADDRDDVHAIANQLRYFAGHSVTITVKDATLETFSRGYVKLDFDKAVNDSGATGTLTVICPDPRRLSTQVSTAAMFPGDSTNALMFDDNNCLVWPVTFNGDTVVNNVGTITNNGTSTAYPIITTSGSFSDGFAITDLSNGKQLAYSQPVNWNSVVLDCKSMTANIDGIDVTRNLTQRHFPVLEPGGSLTVSLNASGSGSISIECRDTYI